MDIAIDIRTAVLFGALLSLLFALLVGSMVGRFPAPMRPALRLWTLATALQPAAFLCLGFRDLVPALVGVAMANLLFALSFGSYLLAVRRFFALPPAPGRWLVGTAALVVVAASLAWPDPDAGRLRVVVGSLAFGILGAAALLALRGAPAAERGPALATLAAIFATQAILMLARAGQHLFGAGSTEVFAATPPQLAVFAFGAALPPIGTLGFLLLCADRVRGALERAARFDFLTELANRRSVYAGAEAAIAGARRTGQPLAVAVLDVDRFKRINDDLGHREGDRALVLLAERLRAAARGEDLVGRIGGEEFVLVLPRAGREQARAAAERLRSSIEAAPLQLGGREWRLTVSIGVATLQTGDDFDALLQRADRALYAAKEASRNRVCVAGDPGAGEAQQPPS